MLMASQPSLVLHAAKAGGRERAVGSHYASPRSARTSPADSKMPEVERGDGGGLAAGGQQGAREGPAGEEGDAFLAEGRTPPRSSLMAEADAAASFPHGIVADMETLMLGQSDQGRVLRTGDDVLTQALTVLTPDAAGYSVFVATLASASLNVYSIISRWVERPDRDPEQAYNMTALLLAWFEGVMLIPIVGLGLLGILQYTVLHSSTPSIEGAGHGTYFRAQGLAKCSNAIRLLSAFSMFGVMGGLKHFLMLSWHKAFGRSKRLSSSACEAVKIVLMFVLGAGGLAAVGAFAAVVKVSQVALFAGQPLDTWSGADWIQLVAFVNNLVLLDHSKLYALHTINALLFYGEDAERDLDEFVAVETFNRLLCAQMLENTGLFKTIVGMVVRDAGKWQRILVKEGPEGRHAAHAQFDGQFGFTLEGLPSDTHGHLNGTYKLDDKDMAQEWPTFKNGNGVICFRAGHRWCLGKPSPGQANKLPARECQVSSRGALPVGNHKWRYAVGKHWRTVYLAVTVVGTDPKGFSGETTTATIASRA